MPARRKTRSTFPSSSSAYTSYTGGDVVRGTSTWLLLKQALRSLSTKLDALLPRPVKRFLEIATPILILYIAWKLRAHFRFKRRRPKFKATTLDTIQTYQARSECEWDVCIVGSGPAGSTCAFYLAQQNLRVLILEKATFPKDKVCGDTISPQAQLHLEKMGVLREVLDENIGRWVRNGGFVSPNGKSFIGEFVEEQSINIQRILLDEKLAQAATRHGAVLQEHTEVKSIEFCRSVGQWKINAFDASEGLEKSFRAQVLVAADGALSLLARSIGVIKTPPNTVCARVFAEAGTHKFRADSVLFYPIELVPGYIQITHEAEDVLNITCFLIPGGKAKPENLFDLFSRILEEDPEITEVLGPDVVLSPVHSWPLRVGGENRSCGDHFLVIGDAAGQVDPLTGEGVQYAMTAAKIAAEVLSDAFQINDFSEHNLKTYHERWSSEFGRGFFIMLQVAKLFAKFPYVLDSAAEVIQQGGAEAISSWSLVRTGARSKLWYMNPEVGPAIIISAICKWCKTQLNGWNPFSFFYSVCRRSSPSSSPPPPPPPPPPSNNKQT